MAVNDLNTMWQTRKMYIFLELLIDGVNMIDKNSNFPFFTSGNRLTFSFFNENIHLIPHMYYSVADAQKNFHKRGCE